MLLRAFQSERDQILYATKEGLVENIPAHRLAKVVFQPTDLHYAHAVMAKKNRLALTKLYADDYNRRPNAAATPLTRKASSPCSISNLE